MGFAALTITASAAALIAVLFRPQPRPSDMNNNPTVSQHPQLTLPAGSVLWNGVTVPIKRLRLRGRR